MYEDPSLRGPFYRPVIASELDIGITHAAEKFPDVELDREMLRELANKILERVAKDGSRFFADIEIGVFESKEIPAGSVHSAYRAAIGKIFGQRRSRNHKRQAAAHSVGVGASDLARSDEGPLTSDEAMKQLELFGFDLESDYLPIAPDTD